MRIAIFGTGGAGGHFGARLAQAGEDLIFIARGEHLNAIRERGLRIETPKGDIVIHPAAASDDPAQVGIVDAIIVGVKTWQVSDAAQAMRPLIGPETIVVPLQNGVEAPSQLAAVLGREPVVGGLCGTFSFIVGPGHIRTIGESNFIRFGELDNRSSQRIERLRLAFARANVDAQIPKDITVALWEKFSFVVPFGGVGAVTRAPVGVIRSLPGTRQMLEQAIREICQVAQARGVALPETAVEKDMAFLDSLSPKGTTSLQRDILDGKPSELEAWNGAVVRLGKEADVPTPLHAFIYQALLPSELRARGRLQFPA